MSVKGAQNEAFTFPRSWYQGLVARAQGDARKEIEVFREARGEMESIVRAHPGYAPPLSILAMIDAALGNKQQAVEEARAAVEWLPIRRDAINGAMLLQHLAIVYAWIGDKDRALEQLSILAEIPSDISYGQLRLHPYWDPLRGDPRFEKIVASLAPQKR